VRRWLAGTTALVLISAAVLTGPVAAAEPTNTVLDWNLYAVNALSNASADTPPVPGQPPPVASIHLAMVQIAVYDAVNSIDKGHEPYLGLDFASRSASKAAAAATAAHDVLVGLVPALPASTRAGLDTLYQNSLSQIGEGSAKRNGIKIGAAVARELLAQRANDGRYGAFRFTPGSGVGVWRPTSVDGAGNPINDPNGWVARVRPFTLLSSSQFRTAGPDELSSPEYAADYNEVKTLGSNAVPNPRTTEQTNLAIFYTANPLPMMNKALREIADARGLSLTQDARLLAMTSTSSADALINCWDDKAWYNFWRPVTAINDTRDDGNAATEPQAGWAPFRVTPPYPDHPSGYNCFSGAMMQAARGYFGTDNVTFQLTSPATATTPEMTRTYHQFSAVPRATIDGRTYNGFHFRNPNAQGALLGQNVANWVADNYFEPRKHGR
jgi:hypothetical protein